MKSNPDTPPDGLPPHGDVAGMQQTGHEIGRRTKDGKRKRRWWRRGMLIALVLGAGLFWFRVPILRSIAGFLVVDEPAPVADYVWILGGDRRYDRAARLYHSGSATSILVVRGRPTRLQRMGFQSSSDTLTQRELASRGVPTTSITVIPSMARTDWDRARCLRDWMRQRPAVRVVVLCDRFGGRRLRRIFDQVLGEDDAGRVRLIGLPERSYDENDWWLHREAFVDVFGSYVSLAYTRLWGEEKEEWREWDPKEYEKTLR